MKKKKKKHSRGWARTGDLHKTDCALRPTPCFMKFVPIQVLSKPAERHTFILFHARRKWTQTGQQMSKSKKNAVPCRCSNLVPLSSDHRYDVLTTELPVSWDTSRISVNPRRLIFISFGRHGPNHCRISKSYSYPSGRSVLFSLLRGLTS